MALTFIDTLLSSQRTRTTHPRTTHTVRTAKPGN